MSWTDSGPHDDAIAYRLILCVLNDNEDAYDAIMDELGCIGCAHRAMNALAHLAAFLMVRNIGTDPGDRALAIADVEHRLAVLLDRLAGDR
jgi:hypothetical protein